MLIPPDLKAAALARAAEAAESAPLYDLGRDLARALLDKADRDALTLAQVPREAAQGALQVVRKHAASIADMGREGLILAMAHAALGAEAPLWPETLAGQVAAWDGSSAELAALRDRKAALFAAAKSIVIEASAGAARAALPLLLGIL